MKTIALVFLCSAAGLIAEPGKDFWRAVDGKTNYVKGPGWDDYFAKQWVPAGRKPIGSPGWFLFYGSVIAVSDDGVLVRGSCELMENFGEEKDFFIVHYPFRVVDGDYIDPSIAKYVGTFDFGGHTVRKFDYGRICSAPVVTVRALSAQEVAEAKAKADKARTENQAKALAYNLKQAEAGDAYGEFRMGERCRDGEGVAKDLRQARAWFAKAAAQGHTDAIAALSKIPSQ